MLNLDADFVPTVETRDAVHAAVTQHGYAAGGRQLKRAVIVPPFSAQRVFSSSLNFNTIIENLGDDASHAINSWPEVPAHEGDERQYVGGDGAVIFCNNYGRYQCHANIDVQRWLVHSQQAAGDAALPPTLYKVPMLALGGRVFGWNLFVSPSVCMCDVFVTHAVVSQIPFSYGMEPYYVVPSQGLASVM